MRDDKRFIKLQCQFKKPWREEKANDAYEVKPFYMMVDETKTNRENLDIAFEKVQELGADINKTATWCILTEQEYAIELFNSMKENIPLICRKWQMKKGHQSLYGDVLDWLRDEHNDIYHLKSSELLARLIIGEYVVKNRLL